MAYVTGSTRVGGYPELRGGGGVVTSTGVLPETSASPEWGIKRRYRNVPHKSKHSYISTLDSPGLRGHRNRAPLWSDQVFPKGPTYPSDTLLIRAAPAHLRTLTDIHNNFLLINLQHTSHSPHGAFLITPKHKSQVYSG